MTESTPKDKSEEKDKKAEKVAKDAAPKAKKQLPKFVVPLVCAVVAFAVGLCGGYFAFGGAQGGASGSLSGKTTVKKAELDSTIATYTYKGKTYKVSARDVVNSTSSLSSQKQDDGTYKLPSVDGVLSYARSAIIQQEAEAKGIKVSEKDMKSYAQSTLGSSDYSSIASSYGMSKSTVKALVKQSAEMQKLRDKVVKTKAGTAPTAPTEPSDGNTRPRAPTMRSTSSTSPATSGMPRRAPGAARAARTRPR